MAPKCHETSTYYTASDGYTETVPYRKYQKFGVGMPYRTCNKKGFGAYRHRNTEYRDPRISVFCHPSVRMPPYGIYKNTYGLKAPITRRIGHFTDTELDDTDTDGR